MIKGVFFFDTIWSKKQNITDSQFLCFVYLCCSVLQKWIPQYNWNIVESGVKHKSNISYLTFKYSSVLQKKKKKKRKQILVINCDVFFLAAMYKNS
jgi:hypothetical protein